MAILIGIDEAGYGPILGPLVVSAAGFEVPDELISTPLWDILRQSICKNRQGSSGRIVINDSKKLHTRRGDYALLQRGVLSCLKARANHTLPSTLENLLNTLNAKIENHINDYPWYNSNITDWPLKYDSDDIDTAAAALERNMTKNNLNILGLWCRPLPAGLFNQLVDAMNNKASVLFHLAGQLIYHAWQNFSEKNLHIVIDKHSGRIKYRDKLQKIFPDLQMKIIKENESTSSYHLTAPNRSMKIHFLEKGDLRQMPIALASMTSKYIRELFMEMLNTYFQSHCPDLAPTAGYYKDGKRFLSDLQSHNLAPHLAPRHLLVRQR